MSDGYSLEGHYTVTIETLLKSVMRWELVLNVPGDFTDRAFYQVYTQINTSQNVNEPFYESFHFTLLYQTDINGAITENNAWIFSFCDEVVFSDI